MLKEYYSVSNMSEMIFSAPLITVSTAPVISPMSVSVSEVTVFDVVFLPVVEEVVVFSVFVVSFVVTVVVWDVVTFAVLSLLSLDFPHEVIIRHIEKITNEIAIAFFINLFPFINFMIIAYCNVFIISHRFCIIHLCPGISVICKFV